MRSRHAIPGGEVSSGVNGARPPAVPAKAAKDLPTDLQMIPAGPFEALPDRVQAARTALWLCSGNLKGAAQLLGLKPGNLAAFVQASSYLKTERDAARLLIVDMAESVVIEQLASEEVERRDNAARFVLQTLGRAQGWGEVKNPQAPTGSVQLNAPGGGTVTVRWGDEVADVPEAEEG